jgi:hypothetical protein
VAPLDDIDRTSLRQANESLAKFHRAEEYKWAQCHGILRTVAIGMA